LRFAIHDDEIEDLHFCREGLLVAICSEFKRYKPQFLEESRPVGATVRILELEIQRVSSEFRIDNSHPSYVALAPSEDRIYVAEGVLVGVKTPLTVWSLDSGSVLRRAKQGLGGYYGIAYLPESNQLLTVVGGSLLKISDAETLDVVGEIDTGFTGQIRRMAVNQRDEQVLIVGTESQVKVVDLSGVRPMRDYSLHRGYYVIGASWHPNGTQFATADGDGMICVWDADTGERERVIEQGLYCERMIVRGATGLTQQQRSQLEKMGAIV